MQRIYFFIIIAAIVFAVSYIEPIKNFLNPAGKMQETTTFEKESLGSDDSYEQMGIKLYSVATKLSDLQGKAQLLKMAKENREWLESEDYTLLDDLIKATEDDLKRTEVEYQKTKEEYAKRTVQKMLKEFSAKN